MLRPDQILGLSEIGTDRYNGLRTSSPLELTFGDGLEVRRTQKSRLDQALEQEDGVDTEGRLLVSIVQTGNLVVVPIEANFRSYDNIGVGFVVHAHRQRVDVGFVTVIGVDTFLVVPLESSADGNAVAERVDQVLVDIECVAATLIVLIIGV